jgi:hypothetical protein
MPLSIETIDMPHDSIKISTWGTHKEMVMIPHQTIGMDFHPEPHFRLFYRPQERLIISGSMKNPSTGTTAIRDMIMGLFKLNAKWSRHRRKHKAQTLQNQLLTLNPKNKRIPRIHIISAIFPTSSIGYDMDTRPFIAHEEPHVCHSTNSYEMKNGFTSGRPAEQGTPNNILPTPWAGIPRRSVENSDGIRMPSDSYTYYTGLGKS